MILSAIKLRNLPRRNNRKNTKSIVMNSSPPRARDESHKPAVSHPYVGNVPISILSDSYKATHFLQYPQAREMVAYGEFRHGFNKDKNDSRLVSYGIRYLIENYISKQWTENDVDKAFLFSGTHMAPNYTEFPFPRDLLLKFVRENDGYFPVKIEALPEGTCVHARTPVYQVTASEEYTPLCTYLETLLTMLWYPTTVATLSRRVRDIVEDCFERTVDEGRNSPLVRSRLHDFGFRGCTSVEQSIIGGCAHLLNFVGTDTMSAAYYAQYALNNGKPVGQSIPASEHSVMTSWPTELLALENLIENFGSGIFACVMDSYDYGKALAQLLPAIASKQIGKGGCIVLRPDSGDPIEAVLQALHAADKVFGSTINSKGYKELCGCGVIQGDGMDLYSIERVCKALEAKGFSAANVSFGMGGGLLQKVNRDTMSFATKLNFISYGDGRCMDVMKQPVTDEGKFSLPGKLAVKNVNGIPTVFPQDSGEVAPEENLFKVVYDKRPVPGVFDSFEVIRERVEDQWTKLPRTADNISASLRKKVEFQRREKASHCHVRGFGEGESNGTGMNNGWIPAIAPTATATVTTSAIGGVAGGGAGTGGAVALVQTQVTARALS